MINSKSPSVLQIIRNDYYAFLLVVTPVLFWAIYLYQLIRMPDVPPTSSFLPAALVVTVLVIPLFGWRYWTVASFINYGIETQAIVHNISFHRGRGKISYVYSFRGQKYVGGNTIIENKITKSFQIGDQIRILVDQNNPKRTLIQDLFI